MQIDFWKYQANGNDFVICDNRKGAISLNEEQISQLCNRRFGIGADGLMLIGASDKYDYRMEYYNSDGRLSSMCGNGGRCIALCVFLNRMAGQTQDFEAFDGVHHAVIDHMIDSGRSFQVSLEMGDVDEVERNDSFMFMDTGSPHYVEFVEHLAEFDVLTEGRNTRNSERFMPDGTNVNFVEIKKDKVYVRTYERGVEEETLSCGTGVCASAIAVYIKTGKMAPKIHSMGGDFKVAFDAFEHGFRNLVLTGPATFVYKGSTHV